MSLETLYINKYIRYMNKREKIDQLKRRAGELKREVDYYNAMQLALKLVLNGSYVSPLSF